jgi:hypothetical protein
MLAQGAEFTIVDGDQNGNCEEALYSSVALTQLTGGAFELML